MKIIVAVSENWGIGKDNDLLFSIPTDMKFFRETTKGHTVVMGRKTLESFPGGNPLKNRTNIVISKTLKPDEKEGIVLFGSIEEFIENRDKFDDEIFIIGGASIYRQMLEYADTALVTKVDSIADADTFMPNLDEDDNWTLAECSEDMTENGLTFRFCTYKRI